MHALEKVTTDNIQALQIITKESNAILSDKLQVLENLLKQIIKIFRHRQENLEDNQAQHCVMKLERNNPKLLQNQP